MLGSTSHASTRTTSIKGIAPTKTYVSPSPKSTVTRHFGRLGSVSVRLPQKSTYSLSTILQHGIPDIKRTSLAIVPSFSQTGSPTPLPQLSPTPVVDTSHETSGALLAQVMIVATFVAAIVGCAYALGSCAYYIIKGCKKDDKKATQEDRRSESTYRRLNSISEEGNLSDINDDAAKLRTDSKPSVSQRPSIESRLRRAPINRAHELPLVLTNDTHKTTASPTASEGATNTRDVDELPLEITVKR